ncbi:MAG: MerR family transcriptional regulator [Lachnospiraceae bacterium]|nr:MerR family transcriptional regulator [Lachnospiraceae bacterium]
MGYKVKWIEDHLGVTRKALRTYEEKGLMPKNEGGQYRDYTDEDIDRIWSIKVLQGMGYSLKEIANIGKDDDFDPDESIAEKIKDLEKEQE